MRPRSGLTLLGIILALASAAAHATARGTQEGALSRAVGAGDIAAVRSLLASGVDPNTPDGPRLIRPLATAARQSRLDVMTALLNAGADPNLPDQGGNRWIPLMHAVHKHQAAAVRFLLDHGARPDGPADLRVTPLMMAAASGQTQTVALLIDRGADARRRTPDGATLLTLAVSGGALTDIDEPLLGACHTDTVKLLRSRIPDVGIDRSWRGRLAVWFARLNRCNEVLELVRQAAR